MLRTVCAALDVDAVFLLKPFHSVSPAPTHHCSYLFLFHMFLYQTQNMEKMETLHIILNLNR